ncbi:MAG: Bug family tripartite tricarboxylate transporter substrate binding protein [Beijerinckiaceae bacterium]
MDRRSFTAALGGFLLGAGASSVSIAQEAFPTRTVRIIVPFPAGSALDGLTRIVAEGLNRAWGGKGVVVENVAGGGGNIGAQRVARADPDGYTILSSAPGPLVLNKLLYKDTPFEAERFVPLSLISTVPNVLVVRNDLPARSLSDFIAYGKANPGKLNYASQGVGSTGFLTGRALEVATRTQMVHVPYRGAAQILTDIAAGHIDSFFDTVTTSLPLHQAGKARILGVADVQRIAALPDVPAIGELVPGFRSITWFAMVAPEGAPPALADRISRDIVNVVRSPEVSDRIRTLNMTIRATNPAETAAFLTSERAYWSKLVADIGFESQ